MTGRSGERGPGISVLAARHDDDDDAVKQPINQPSFVHIYIYIYIKLRTFIYMLLFTHTLTHTHTHTHTYIYIYKYVCVCVCVCVCENLYILSFLLCELLGNCIFNTI